MFRLKKQNILRKDKLNFIVISAALLFFCIFLYCKITIPRSEQPWIKAASSGLIKNGKPFRFIGANAVNLVFYDNWGLSAEEAIRAAKENNISVLRFYMDWGWSKDEDFDSILNTASKYGIYVILTLTDCCCSSNYADLKTYFEVHAPFCNIEEERGIDAFKKRIKEIIGRKNSINGKIYRNDPVILAWEIANELEYWHFDNPRVRNWITEIAKYIKSQDVNHLVTIGISTDNPDFNKDSAPYSIFDIADLDFISFHFYPATNSINSKEATPEQKYLQEIKFRIKEFLSLHKPVIMEEFGFSNSAEINFKVRNNAETRDFYNEFMGKSMDSAFLVGASGVMFWGWGVPEEKNIPMWWKQESHSTVDKKFCEFIRNYRIPQADEK